MELRKRRIKNYETLLISICNILEEEQKLNSLFEKFNFDKQIEELFKKENESMIYIGCIRKFSKIKGLVNELLNKNEEIIDEFEKIIKKELNINEENEILDRIHIGPQNGNSPLELYAVGYFLYKKDKDILFEHYMSNIENDIKHELDIKEDLKENKMYNKYVKKRIEQICEYLEIEKDATELYETIFYHLLFYNNIDGSFYDEDDDSDLFCYEQTMDEAIITLPDDNNENTISQLMSTLIVSSLNAQDIMCSFRENERLRSAFISATAFIQNTAYIINNQSANIKKIYEFALDEMLMVNLRRCIFNHHLENDTQFTTSMIVRMGEIENMELFLSELINKILLYLLYSDIEDDVSRICKYEIDSNKINKAEEYEAKIDNYEKENKKLLNEIENLKKKFKELEKEKNEKITEIKNEIEKQYKEELFNKNKTIEKQNEQIKKYEENMTELSNLRSFIFEQEQNDEYNNADELNLEIDINIFKDKRYIFIGGRRELLNRLKEIFPKSKFYRDAITGGINIASTEKIICFPKAISHSLYYEFMDISKVHNIPFVYINSTNYEKVLYDIANSEE